MQSRNGDTGVENNIQIPREEQGDEMYWEIGGDIYAGLCVKQMTNEYLLERTRNAPQCTVVTHMWRKSKNQGIYVYMELIPFAVQQRLTTL